MAIEQKVGVYYSRSRSEIWVKGKTSGAVQQLLGIRVDCDFDTLKFTVDQGPPGFCHKGTHSCFGVERSISEVLLRLESRVRGEDAKSFTKKLIEDPDMLAQNCEKKLRNFWMQNRNRRHRGKEPTCFIFR